MKHLGIFLFLSLFSGFAAPVEGAEVAGRSTIYDRDPNHLWNRLNETLFDRTAQDAKRYGLDELDILYWGKTKHLLVEPSHHAALAILDEFIKKHGEKLIHDPLKRALLQRDLWELFDWSARSSFRTSSDLRACRNLQPRLVTVIRRLALTTNEIALLPENYAQSENGGAAGLPAGLMQTNGDWIVAGIAGYSDWSVAPFHIVQFDGHSAFSVLLNVPKGRVAAISYLDSLRLFKQHHRILTYRTNTFSSFWTNSPDEVLDLNPRVPQFPTNTEWALVRRMCVIDTEGRIQPTRFTESIQVRRYLDPKREIPDLRFSTNDVQEFFEFQMDRRHGGMLRAIGQNETGFVFVHGGTGIDLFEDSDWFHADESQLRDSKLLQAKVLGNCYQCHSGPGIFSVNSYTASVSPLPQEKPNDLAPIEISRDDRAAVDWKQQQFNWGLLQGLWRQAN